MAFTRARLSFFVRPFTDGTVIGGSLSAESLAAVAPVLDAVLDAGVDEAAPVTPCGAVARRGPAGGSASTPGDGCASLLAAQARDAISAKEVNTGIDEYLLNTIRCMSGGSLRTAVEGSAAGT